MTAYPRAWAAVASVRAPSLAPAGPGGSLHRRLRHISMSCGRIGRR